MSGHFEIEGEKNGTICFPDLLTHEGYLEYVRGRDRVQPLPQLLNKSFLSGQNCKIFRYSEMGS